MKRNHIRSFNYSGHIVEGLDEVSFTVGFSIPVDEGIPRAILRKYTATGTPKISPIQQQCISEIRQSS